MKTGDRVEVRQWRNLCHIYPTDGDRGVMIDGRKFNRNMIEFCGREGIVVLANNEYACLRGFGEHRFPLKSLILIEEYKPPVESEDKPSPTAWYERMLSRYRMQHYPSHRYRVVYDPLTIEEWSSQIAVVRREQTTVTEGTGETPVEPAVTENVLYSTPFTREELELWNSVAMVPISPAEISPIINQFRSIEQSETTENNEQEG